MKITAKNYSSWIAGLSVFGLILSQSVAALPAIQKAESTATIVEKLSTTRVPFVRNDGQMDAVVAYRASTLGGQIFVTHNNTLVYNLAARNLDGNTVSWAFSEEFVAVTDPVQVSKPFGIEPSAIRISQFKNSASSRWRSHLKTFDAVSLGEQFPGVTVILRATGNNVEKLFYLAPGAIPADIKLTIKGVNKLDINAQQELVLATDLGDITFTAPFAYQVNNGRRKPVPVSYVLLAENQYGFKVSKYDPELELIIDPLLASTFVGGVDSNTAWSGNYDHDIAYSVLSYGDSIYIGGVTQSTDFPTLMGYDNTPDSSGNPDGFIARFNNELTTLLSATFFGSDNFDRVSAIGMDNGSIVAVGQAGYGFPVTDGAYDQSGCGASATGCGFVAKFSADLSMLVASSIVTPLNYPTTMAVGNGGIYFGGRTNSPNYPITPNAYLSTCCAAGAYGIREYDGFAGKISSDLSTLQAMTYLGGDEASAMAVAAADSSVYIADGFPTGVTGYLAQFDGDLSTRYAQVTYYPGTNSGSSRHYFRDIAVTEKFGFVVAVGETYLNDLPVTDGAYDMGCGSDGDCNNTSSSLYRPKSDGFIAKYSLGLQKTLGLSYFGGSENDVVESVVIDSYGAIIVAGNTLSPDFDTTGNAHDNSCGSDGNCNPVSGYVPLKPYDVFVAKFNADLSALEYSSFLGGGDYDSVFDIALLPGDRVVVAGSTASQDFPVTVDAFDTSYAGGVSENSDTDAFISVFEFDLVNDNGGGPDPDPDPDPGPDPEPTNAIPIADAGIDQEASSRQKVYLDGSDSEDFDGDIVNYQWIQVSGKGRKIRNSNQAIANFRAPRLRKGRTYSLVFELVVTDNLGATASDRVTVEVR